MLETLDNLHPRRVEKGKLVPYTCCNTCGGFSIGCNFCFCGTEKPSPEVIKYGPAFTQYFRQVKSSIFFTIWCALLLTLLVWFYSEAYKVSTSKDQSANEVDGASVFLELRDWTLSASLGGYASSSAQFYEANFTNISTLDSSTNRITGNDNPNSIGLTCVLGSLDVSPTFTYYGLIPKRFPASYTFYMYVKSENNATNFYNAISSCEGQKKCTVAYNSNWFQGAAEDYISGKQGGEAHKFYLKYRCKDIELTYFGKTLKKETLNALIIIIYVVLLISFLGYLWAWSHFEDKIFSFFRDHHPLPSDYTIKLKELPQNLSEPEFKESLLKHFQAFHKSVGVRPDAIVDIQVAKNNEIMYYDAKLKKLNTELQNIIEMLVNEKTIPRPEEGKPLDVDYVKTYFNQHPANFKEKVAKRRIENFFELLTKKQRNDLKRQEKGKNQSKFESAFITFDYHQSKVKVFNKMNISKWQRWTSGCSDKASINKFEGKVLRVEQACEPDNINWHNLQTSGCQKFMRRLLSWTLTIALVAVPLVIVILISRSLKDTEPLKLNCPPSGTFSKEVISSNSDSSKAIRLALVKDYESPNSENLMFCYCFESFRERFNQ